VARYCHHFCSAKTVGIKYYDSVFLTLVTQHAKQMRRIILSPVALSGSTTIFPTLCRKQQDLGKNLFKMK